MTDIIDINVEEYRLGVKGAAFVHGASGGIGRAVAISLAANGASGLVLTYNRGKEKTEALARALEEKFGVKAHVVQLQFPLRDEDEASVRELLEEGARVLGEDISIVVNAAGISPNQNFEEQRIDSDDPVYPGWIQVFHNHMFSPMIMTRAVGAYMSSHKIRGAITHITSTNGVNSYAQFSAHYDSAKAALIKFIANIAQHYMIEYGIRLNGVAPGWVATPMNDSVPDLESEIAKIWLGRQATPAEIANVITFVSGLGGSYIVGQGAIIADGGYR